MTQEVKLLFSPNPDLVATNPPPIPKAGAWAANYIPTPSTPLINLAQGVPGSPPPVELQKRLADAAGDPSTTGYGDLRGDAGLREELVKDVFGVYGTAEGDTPLLPEEVVITAGANLGFYATMIALAKAGDEVILPTPWYFNNEMTLKQLGIKCVSLVSPPPSFQPSVSVCRSLITAKTKAIVLVTPNNPTGAIYHPALIAEFAALARETKVALVVDETYREFMYERPHDLFSLSGEGENWRGYLIHMFSFSKSYAIPGHRLGALIAPLSFQVQIAKTMDCMQICPARPAQRAITWAIEGTRKWREGVRDEIRERGRVFVEVMKEAEGWRVDSVGGYFAYVRHPFPGTASEPVAARLAEFVGIIVLPGTFFAEPFANVDDDRYLRFSIANVSSETLRKVPERLVALNKMWKELPPLAT